MAILDKITKKSREWERLRIKCIDEIQRAASLQAYQCGVISFESEASKLINLYRVNWKRMGWQEYGDVAFHLIAKYPPDLAYTILYAFRKNQTMIGYDPVPLILKAIEVIYYLQPKNLTLYIEMTNDIKKLSDYPEERAKKGAKVIVREISVTPLRWASGIFHNEIDPTIKSFIKDQMKDFNPIGYDILMKASRIWLITPIGVLRRLKLSFFKSILI